MHSTFTILLQGLLTQSAFANPNYDGPEISHQFSTARPNTLTVCDEERFNTSIEVYKMCTKAQQAAENFAEQFAGQEGAIQGYLRGYTWGLYSSTTVTQDSERWMAVGLQEVDTLSQYWKPAMTEGATVGAQKGSQSANEEVVQRFRKAVNTTSFPSSSFSVPSSDYEPKSNAYIIFVRKDSPIPTAEALLNSDEFQRPVPIFESINGTPFVERSQTPVAFWYSNETTNTYVNETGTYALNTEVWSSMNRAFNVWKNHPYFTDDVAVYSRFVNTGERTGAPASEGTVDDTKLGLLMSDLYEVVFQVNYEHWANYYFSKSFQQQLNNGQLAGERLGKDIGSQIAIERGLEQAFNDRFIAEGRAAYQDSYHDAYTNTFYDTYDDYAKTPHLELSIDRVIGTVDDGIIQPGEPIQLEYRITNIGGVSATGDINVKGSIQNQTTQRTTRIMALTSEQRTTAIIADIDPRLQARDKATIKMTINDTSASIEQVVNRLVEIVTQDINIDTLKGSGQIAITAKNLSTKPTRGDVSATLSIDEQSISLSVGPISAGKTKTIRLDISDLNPLTIIEGKQKASVTLYHKSEAMDTQSVSIQSQNPNQELIQYFDQMVNGRGSIPSTVAMPDQIDAIMASIVRSNRSEVAQHNSPSATNIFRKTPGETYVGILSQTFSSHNQSEFAVEYYDKLARMLIKETSQFNPFLGMSPKRKHYRKLVRSFAKDSALK
mgnify:CR=1 FL=1